jgi:CRP-like cAMP-binding protein
LPSRNLFLASLGPALELVKRHLKQVSFKASTVVCEPGVKRDIVIFPVSGLISSRAVLASGHQLECGLIGRTNLSGAVAARGDGVGMTRVVCLTDVHGWAMPLSRLRAAMSEPRIEAQVLRFAGAQILYTVNVGICNAMHGADQRLARWLSNAIMLLDSTEIRVAQEELAQSLGIQRSALNPILQRFKAEGLIDLGRGRLLVRDQQGLQQRSCGCHHLLARGLLAAPSAPAS